MLTDKIAMDKPKNESLAKPSDAMSINVGLAGYGGSELAHDKPENEKLATPRTLGGISIQKKYRPGKHFEMEVRESFKHFQDKTHGELYWLRLYDWYDMQRKIPPKKQPADFLMVYRGLFYLVECKSCQLSSFPFDNIRDHQRDSLLNVQVAGGVGLYLIQHCTPTSKEVYAITADVFKSIQTTFLKEGRKSVKWEELKTVSTKLPQLSARVWDLGGVLAHQSLLRQHGGLKGT